MDRQIARDLLICVKMRQNDCDGLRDKLKL